MIRCVSQILLIIRQKNTNMKNSLIILLLLLLSTTIGATNYYIDPSGSDSNSGSSSSPWKTLSYACSKATTSGDIIHVNAGTYAENMQCSLAVGVSIVGEGDASLITTNYNGGYHHGTIALLSATGTPVDGNQSVSYIKIDGGNNAGTTGICIQFRNNVTVHHCTLVNFAGSDAYYAIYNFSNQNNYLTPPTTHATGNAVYNCTFNNCNVYTQGLSGYQFYNNTFNNSVNIELLSSDWMKGFIIHDNVFTKANETVGWHFWGELYHWSDNSEIYNNIFNGSASLDLSDVRKGNGTWGLKVYNNQFLLSAVGPDNLNHNLHPLNFEGWGALQYIYVYNNHFKNTPTAISVGGSNAANCVYPDGTHWALDHIYIYYNIFENVGCTNNTTAATIWFFDYAASGYSYNHSWDNVFVCNNVFSSTASPNQNAEGIYLSHRTTATNFHIDNNIIIGYPSVAIKFQYGSNFNTISLQKNLFYNNGSNTIAYGSTPTNKTENNLSPANPLFVSSSDFHLQAGSPAIGKGIAITGLTTDYAGNAVKNPPSIGAFEGSAAVLQQALPVHSSVVQNIPPLVSILNPLKGNAYENLSSVEIDAIASDPDGTISKVEFFNGPIKLVELTSAPYTYIWKDVHSGNYSITAIAIDNLNDTTISLPVEFYVGIRTKYDVNSDIVKLYPNPNNGYFTIEFISPLQIEKGEIIISDLAGKQVYNSTLIKEESSKQFDLSMIKSGMYVMIIMDKETIVTKKFIKN